MSGKKGRGEAVPKKTRKYEDYLELGLQLHSARDALMAAHIKSSMSFGKTKQQTRKLRKLTESLDELRCLIDAEYCREACSHDVPQGMPQYPLYMKNWLDRNPIERLRLEEGAA